MDNPLMPLALMWRTRRPSKLEDMPAVRNRFWLRRGYSALTFFGTIITASTEIADRMGTNATGVAEKEAETRRVASMSSLKRHEMIHLRQAQSVNDSWLLFYLRYLWYYVGGLSQNRRMRNAAYLINPFEMEAYRHQDEADYLERCRDGANGWRVYAKMKASERLKEYKKPTIK